MRVVTCLALVAAFQHIQAENPVERVVQLIEGLKSKIQADGTTEQQLYDKYACWCEKTTARKAASIENAKQLIEDKSSSILKLKGRMGSYVPEINKLTKDIAETNEAINTADEMRKKESEEYLSKKSSMEQGLGNLEKAVEVLGAATVDAKPNLLKDDPNRQATAETKLLTVMAGVRSAISQYSAFGDHTVDKSQVSSVKTFLSNPFPSWIETRANPAMGTYNSQSGQIQGILSQMVDDFKKELESSAEAESQAELDHTSLMETKRADLALLEQTLTKTTLAQGDDKKQLAEDSQEREETQDQLKTDETFFDETKAACKTKADQWSGRSRARTEELAAIDQALGVLTSEESKAIFERSHTTFLQFSAKETVAEMGPTRTKVFNMLKKVATATDSLGLAAIASKVKATWHFDAVIADIDKMIRSLRAEAKADIEHRDWCEEQTHATNSRNSALEYDMDQLNAEKERAENKMAELEVEVEKTETEISDLNATMVEALQTRNTENAAFKSAMQDDADAVKLIGQALDSLSGFYSFAQQPNEDAAPETFAGDYGGRKSEGGGVLAILSMIKEDIEKEMKTSRADENSDLTAYEKLRSDSFDSMNALKAKKVSLGEDIAAKLRDIAAVDTAHGDKTSQKEAGDDLLGKLKPNCDWITSKFTVRQEKRTAEIDGLDNAKSALAGAGGGAPEEKLIATKATQLNQHQSVDDALKALDAETKSLGGKSFLQRT